MDSFWGRDFFSIFFRKSQKSDIHPNALTVVSADRLWLFNINPGHEPVKLLPGKSPCFLTVPWPTIPPLGIQPFVNQDKSVTFPQKGLEPVALPATEQEQRV